MSLGLKYTMNPANNSYYISRFTKNTLRLISNILQPSQSLKALETILYLQWHEAPWGFSGRLHRQTPQESSPLQPENSCPVYPIRGGSAWLLHALPQDPGPAEPDVPSAA